MNTSMTFRRLEAVDQFRGLAIVLMVLVNYAAGVNIIPAWFKHAPDTGFTTADAVAPLFIFAIGLTYGLSARRRLERDGRRAAISHFVRRSLSILGIGALISAGETGLGFNHTGIDWGVLQTIGVAGLLTLFVIFLPPLNRLVLGLGLLAVYQGLHDALLRDWVFRSPHGGLGGGLSWAGMLVVATVLADLYHDAGRRKFFPWASLLALAAGIALGLVIPVSKNRVSISYDLVSLGLSGLIFSVFYLGGIRIRLLSIWGQNPLILYILHFLLLGLVVLPEIPGWYNGASLWVAGLQALALLGILSIVATHLRKRGITISL